MRTHTSLILTSAILAWLLFIGFAVVALANPAENLTPKIMVAGIAVRAFVLSQFPQASLWGDEADYLARGVRLARGGALEGIDRAPGYVFFLAAMAKLSGVPLEAARWGQ